MEEASDRINRVREWALGEYTINERPVQGPGWGRRPIGIASWSRKETGLELLARADALMYSDKRMATVRGRALA
jgi:hypothetical protein